MKIYKFFNILVILCWLVKSMEIDESLVEQIKEYKNPSYLKPGPIPYFQTSNKYSESPEFIKETMEKTKLTEFNFENNRLLQKFSNNREINKLTHPILSVQDFFENDEFKKMAKCQKKKVVDELNHDIEEEMKEIHPDVIKNSKIALEINAITKIYLDGIEKDIYTNNVTRFRAGYAFEYWENMKNAIHHQILRKQKAYLFQKNSNEVIRHLVVKTFFNIGMRDYYESRDKIANGILTGTEEVVLRLVYDHYSALKVIQIGYNKTNDSACKMLRAVKELLPDLTRVLEKYEKTQKDSCPLFMYLKIKKFHKYENEFIEKFDSAFIDEKQEFPALIPEMYINKEDLVGEWSVLKFDFWGFQLNHKSRITINPYLSCLYNQNDRGHQKEYWHFDEFASYFEFVKFSEGAFFGEKEMKYELDRTSCNNELLKLVGENDYLMWTKKEENSGENKGVENEMQFEKEEPCFKFNCLIV